MTAITSMTTTRTTTLQTTAAAAATTTNNNNKNYNTISITRNKVTITGMVLQPTTIKTENNRRTAKTTWTRYRKNTEKEMENRKAENNAP